MDLRNIYCILAALLLLAQPEATAKGMEQDKNLLTNGDFQQGSLGGVPSEWNGPRGSYSLVKNTTYRRGNKVLRISTDGRAAPSMRSRQSFPMPKSKSLRLSFWARAVEGKTTLVAYLLDTGYKWSLREVLQLDGVWRQYTFQTACPSNVRSFVVRFDLQASPCSMELADVSVIWTDKPLPGKKQADRGWLGVPGKNMVYNPGFELEGNGWTVSFYGNKDLAETMRMIGSEETKVLPGQGIDGSKAIYLTSGPALRSHCFPVQRGKTYSISAYMRASSGTGRVWWALVDPHYKIFGNFAQDIPSDRWQRYEFTFVWNKDTVQKRSDIRFINTGVPVLIDNVQVVEGPQCPYEAPAVTLACKPEGAPIFKHMQAGAQLSLRAIPRKGLRGGVKIEVRCKDAWRRDVWKRGFELKDAQPLTEKIPVPTDQLGVFEVRLRAVNSNGDVVGIGRDRYAVVGSPFREKVKNELGLFSVCYEMPRYPPWMVRRAALLLTQLGVTGCRYFQENPYLNIQPDPKWLEIHREQAKILRDHGMALMPCVNLFPKSLFNRIFNARQINPADLNEYQARVKAFARAMDGQIDYLEILNEVNLWRYGNGQKSMGPEKYLAILSACHKAVKSVNPEIKVASPALNTVDMNYLEHMLTLGAAKHMDVFTVHPYRSSPDLPDLYPDFCKLKKVLRQHGFSGPIVNSEQYYAANLFAIANNDEETSRGYTVPHDQELRAAGRTIRSYIQHAAEGIPYAAFSPPNTLFALTPAKNDVFLFQLFAAYNAATRFLVEAGSGKPLPVGTSLRAYLFPSAKGGPLVAIYCPQANIKGQMKIASKHKAFDIMGNPIPAKTLKTKGFRLATDPTYVRFPVGTTSAVIEKVIADAEIMGLGDPFDVQLAVKNRKTLVAKVISKRNRPLSGKVTISQLPAGWKAGVTSATFEGLKPGQEISLPFALEQANIKNMGEYTVTLLVESGEDFVRRETLLRPVFADYLSLVKVDGDLSEWKKAGSTSLGEQHLSHAFSSLPHKGSGDLSAKVSYAWSKKGFGIALTVTDDVHCPPRDQGPNGYMRDSLQLYFDPLGNTDGRPQTSRDDISYLVGAAKGRGFAYISKGTDQRYVGAANQNTGLDGDVKVAVVRKQGRTIYEIWFPKHTLPSSTLRANRSIRFSLLINDNDGSGRKVGLTLHPKGTQPYDNPTGYRDVVFRENRK